MDDHFRIGSVSKTFGAALILQLVDEGLLALDDTVAHAAPELAQQFPQVADISIRDLLGMSSGIPDYMNVPDATVATHARYPMLGAVAILDPSVQPLVDALGGLAAAD